MDKVLNAIVRELREKHRCHTVILYGSRARGQVTPTSDYDVVGVRKTGAALRIAGKRQGGYWDVFVYPEKDLRKLGEQQLSWKQAQILHEDGTYGRNLLRRIERHVAKPYVKKPQFEVDVTKAWAQKQLDRCKAGGVQGLYRRVEFQTALVADYFFVRQKRFWGPKEGFAWLEEHDPKTFAAILRSLKDPGNSSLLKTAATRVYGVRSS